MDQTTELQSLKALMEEIKAKIESGETTSGEMTEKMNELGEKVATLEAANEALVKSIEKHKIPGLDDDYAKKHPFSILKVIRGVAFKDWKNADFEVEVMKKYEEQLARDMGTGTGGAGGNIVPPVYLPNMIEILRAESVVMELGATLMDGMTGSPVEIARQSSGATAYWVGENAAITSSDLAFQLLSMTPNECGALVVLSNRLIKLANPGAESLVQRDIATALALKIDLAALRGDGTGNSPLGISQTPNIGTVSIGTDGGDLTYDIMQEMEGVVEDANALRGRTGYAMNPKSKRILKRQKVAQFTGQTQGQYIILPMNDANLRDALGHDFKGTTQIPTNLTKGGGTNLTEVYFGNWTEVLIPSWGGLEIAQSNVAGDAFAKNQTVIRAIKEVDVALRHPKSFCLVSDANSQ